VVAAAAEAAEAVFFGGSGGVALGCEIEFLAQCVQAFTDTLDDYELGLFEREGGEGRGEGYISRL